MNVVRKALLDVTCEVLPDVLPVLRDHGLVVIGTAPNANPGTVRLMIGAEFDASLLPAECDDGWQIVRAAFTQENYGKQKLVRVTEIKAVGQPLMQLVA
jgi:hypothetical protein